MHLFSRFLSLRRPKSKKNKSRQSSGSSFEYGQPSVYRLSGDFDPYQYRFQDTDHANHARTLSTLSVGIPIRSTSPRSFPVLEHPIDYVPRRVQKGRPATPFVKIHRKKLLQRTEFPNADPPRSPRKVSHAQSEPRRTGRNRSVRRIESGYSASSDEIPVNSPRLDNLRRDPSVLSLVSIMSPDGCIPSDAFSNTPKPSHPSQTPRQLGTLAKSAPNLLINTSPLVRTMGPSTRGTLKPRINAAPVTPRPRSESLIPSFPLHVLPSQTRCVTPESHSFSSVQCEPGSFSLAGDPTEKPNFSTHKSLASASDAFRFLNDRYAQDLLPTPTDGDPCGHSANDAVGESSSATRQMTTSRVPRFPFVQRGGQTLPSRNSGYNFLSKSEPVCFSAPGGLANNASLGSHISHSRVISPLGSPLPVLTRIQPYSLSFSRAHYGTQQADSSSEETTAPSPSGSLWESSHYSPASVDMSPRTPRTAELIQGSPRRSQVSSPAIVVSPSEVSAFEYYQDKKLASGRPIARDTGFADREGVIRMNRPLHASSVALDTQDNDCHMPTHSVYMQSLARNDRHARITRSISRIPIQNGRAGLDISFDFNSGNDVVNADSVGDGLNNDQQEITPGRPTVVLVPSGRRSDRDEPASASAPASVRRELECERAGPHFVIGLDPHFLPDSATQSTISRASSFHTAQEEFVEAERPLSTREFRARTRVGGTNQRTQDEPPKLYLDLSRSPLAATAAPENVSSSRSRDYLHHGTQ